VRLVKTSLTTALLTMALTSGVPISALAAETASNPQQLEALIQKHFQNRDTTFQFTYTGNVSTLKSDTRSAVDNVFEDTYLELAVKSWTYKASGTVGNVTMTFSNEYYTSADQELYVSTKAKEIVSQIIKSGMDDHEKVKVIHDYIVSSVAYDTSASTTSFSPYSALAYKTAVCQGYATLAYKMLTLAGVESEIVIGTANGVNHSWNMVKIDGEWYHLDPTFDDPYPDKPGQVKYNYYNQTTDQIQRNHIFDESNYPSATKNYVEALNETVNPKRYEAIYKALNAEMPVENETIPVEDITFTNGTTHTLNLTDNQTVTLHTNVLPSNATDKTLVWHSGNPSIAEVTQNGIVKAVGKGSTEVIAESKDGKVQAFAYVTVEDKQPTSEIIPVSEILFTSGEDYHLILNEDDTRRASIEIRPYNATDKDVIWTTDNPAIATVDQNGLITAVSAGETNVIVTSKDGKVSAKAKVTIDPAKPTVIPVSSIDFVNGTFYQLNDDNTNVQLTVDVKPNNASNKTVLWTSGNENVATVDSNGNVLAVSSGETIITATSVDGKVSSSARVVVVKESKQPETVPVSSITFKETNNYVLDTKGNNNTKLEVVINPSNATDQTVRWSSSNSEVAIVDDTGRVTALSAGSSKITVSTPDGQISSSATVTVKEPEPTIVPITDIQFTEGTEYLLNTEEQPTKQLRVRINPSDATDKTLIWSSSDENVVVVEDGFIEAIAPGEATINVRNVDGTVSANAHVRVESPVNQIKVQDIRFSARIYKMNKVANNFLALDAQVLPSNATVKTLTWESTDPSVAAVDENGIVTALSGGSTRIIVTSADGEVTETVHIEVEEEEVETPVSDIKFSQKSYNIDLETTKTLKLNPIILPEEASNKNLTWTSSNSEVAEVDDNGKVSILGVGSTSIIATSADGEVTESVRVVVGSNSRVTDIKFLEDRKGVTLSLAKDQNYQLKYVVYPEYASNKKLDWESTDPSIAEVDSNGMLTIKSTGKVTVRATSADGLTMEGIRVVINP